MNYIRVSVTPEFYKMLKIYTQKLSEKENQKNGVRKRQITKKIVCDKVLADMQTRGLI